MKILWGAIHTVTASSAFGMLALVLGSFCYDAIPSSVWQGQGNVCGDPTANCSTSFSFNAHDLPFVIAGKIKFREYRSNFFYAVVLKSIKAEKDDGDCAFVSEEERMEVQRLFPTNKVFSSRAGCPETQIIYDGVNPDYNFLAIFAGRTRLAAERVLQRVKSRYPDANIRRIKVIKGIT